MDTGSDVVFVVEVPEDRSKSVNDLLPNPAIPAQRALEMLMRTVLEGIFWMVFFYFVSSLADLWGHFSERFVSWSWTDMMAVTKLEKWTINPERGCLEGLSGVLG